MKRVIRAATDENDTAQVNKVKSIIESCLGKLGIRVNEWDVEYVPTKGEHHLHVSSESFRGKTYTYNDAHSLRPENSCWAEEINSEADYKTTLSYVDAVNTAYMPEIVDTSVIDKLMAWADKAVASFFNPEDGTYVECDFRNGNYYRGYASWSSKGGYNEMYLAPQDVEFYFKGELVEDYPIEGNFLVYFDLATVIKIVQGKFRYSDMQNMIAQMILYRCKDIPKWRKLMEQYEAKHERERQGLQAERERNPITGEAILDLLESKGIDTTEYTYELHAQAYERYEDGDTYTETFTAPGDYLAYFSMLASGYFIPADTLEDYFGTMKNLTEFVNEHPSVESMKEYASANWWGDGSDYIHYLKNIDTGKFLYSAEGISEDDTVTIFI